MSTETPIGPNVKRLISMRMAMLAIPAGTKDPLMAGIHTILDQQKWRLVVKSAVQWVQEAIAAVRSAPDNSYGDDETIAGEILRRIEITKGGVQ